MTRKPCQNPENCRKPKRGPCSCSYTEEECAAISARNTGRACLAESIAKQLETKRRKGIFLVPPHLKSYNNKLAAHGYRGEERRKMVMEVAQK